VQDPSGPCAVIQQKRSILSFNQGVLGIYTRKKHGSKETILLELCTACNVGPSWELPLQHKTLAEIYRHGVCTLYLTSLATLQHAEYFSLFWRYYKEHDWEPVV
jgi:hypothetical protein